MSPSKTGSRGPGWVPAAAGGLASLVVALGEAVRLDPSIDPRPWMALVATGGTILLLPGLLAGLGAGLLVAALGWPGEPLAMARELVGRVRGASVGEVLGRMAQAVVWLAASALGYHATLAPGPGSPHPAFTGAKVAFVAPAAVVLAVLARWVLSGATDRLLGRRPHDPRWVVGLAATLTLGGMAAALGFLSMYRQILESVDWRMPSALVAWAVVFVVVWAGLRRWPRVALILLWTVPPVAGATVADGLDALDRIPEANEVAATDRGLLGRGLAIAQGLLDFDHDGYSGLLGGGDCVEGDPGINPGADDIPGNGLDEDCDGEDLAPLEPEAPREVADHTDEPTAEPEEDQRARLLPRHNIVLVTVDTLRPDHLGCYGYDRPTSPNIDELAQRSVLFENAYSVSNKTPSVMGSLLSGVYPSEVYRTYAHFNRFLPKNVMLAERLRDAGYRTWGVVSHWYFGKKYGMAQGYDHWDVVQTSHDKMEKVACADHVADLAIQALRTLRSEPGPYHLWLHFIDPHKLYIRHKGFQSFGKRAVDRYDGEILFTDHHLGRFLRELYVGEDWDRTVVVFLADHGEAFGEHGEWHHGWSVHEHQLRVPLLVRIPGVPPRRVSTRVSMIDVVPTILDLAGIHDAQGLRGVSLVDGISSGEDWSPRPIYAEVYPGPYNAAWSAYIEGDLKLIHRWRGNVFALHDLAKDPGEKVNLVRKAPNLARRMKTRYKDFRRRHVDPVEPLRR